ncbi:hypothetical protein GC163_10255 [bacterium]|nr:hypothetical protein [bacterium]
MNIRVGNLTIDFIEFYNRSKHAVVLGRSTVKAWATHRWHMIAICCVLTAFSGHMFADDPPAPPVGPVGQFLTITSPIDDRVLARVSEVALDLEQRARREERPGILILEIRPGTSQYHQVHALARLLTSNQLAGLKTVAWIPETVTGPNVLVALACQEIVMQPDAELGDFGRGQDVEPDDEQLILAIAQKRTNPLVSTALVKSMIDPQVQLWRVRIQSGEGKVETRAATRDEVDTLRQTGAIIEKAEVIKEAGVLGTYRGSTARDLEILVSQIANTRPDVAGLYHLPREALREPVDDEKVQKARLIRVTGVINTLQESFLERQIDRSLRAGAEIIVFEIDSPGGELMASINLSQAIANLDEHHVRTVAYVPREALSGAAIIALGCDEIYMHPTAKLGDAGPIEVRPGMPFERAPEKILSVLRTELKTMAEHKGRPVALCEAMADRSLKVFQATNRDSGRVTYMSEAELNQAAGEWIQGPQVREANGELLLTVEGKRAHELQLAERPVSDLDELKLRLGLPANYRLSPVQKNWVDTTVFILNHPAIVILLFIVAIGSLYIELHFPTGMFGILSVVCFVIFFWSKFLGGTAGWLEILLFALGAGCLALELFVIPGFGVFGLSGILLMLASLVMASQSWGNIEPFQDLRQLGYNLGTFMAAIVACMALALALSRVLPHTPLFESMILSPPGQAPDIHEPRLSPSLLGEDVVTASPLLGQRGEAVSLLRPAGKAKIDNRMVDVISEGPFIPEGSAIEIVQVSGNRIVVRKLG